MSLKQLRIDKLVTRAKSIEFVLLTIKEAEQFKKVTKNDIYKYAEKREITKRIRFALRKNESY
jgi:hypothetical protein